MSIDRIFVDWRRPALPAAAEYLVARGGSGPVVDLRSTIVAVPGARASRRLLEILVDRAAADGRALVPPKLVTVGALPELLYETKKPFAEDFTQHLAWAKALRSAPRQPNVVRLSESQAPGAPAATQDTHPQNHDTECRATLEQFVRLLPDEDDLSGWLALGEMLAGLHRELAADRLEFGHVLEHGRRIPGFDEVSRWELLAEIRQRYLETLDALALWDRQSARLYAIEHRECRSDSHIVLVGAVDLNRSLREMLDQVAEQSRGRVTVLVFAPQELADRFDAHGCLVPEAWQNAVIDGVFERTGIADGPADQATATVGALAGFAGHYAAEDIVVGIPDKSLVPWITQRLDECGLPARYGVGAPVPQTGPGRLLRSVAEFLERRTFAVLAALVRHPDVEEWLKSAGAGDRWLEQLDEYYGERLPFGVPECAEDGTSSEMPFVCRKVEKLTQPLAGRPRPPAEWAPAIVQLLLAVYGRRALDQEHPQDRLVVMACERIREALEPLLKVPAELAPDMTGAEALRHVLRAVEEETVPPLADAPAIELLGWLDLPLDDAPALIVTGFNEGFVPSARNADAFLPNELRRRLNLNDNDRRYARDAYALSVLVHSRRDLKLIAGRRTAEGDPLVPSRLLFACPDADLPERVLRLLERPQPRPVRFAGSLAPGRDRPAFEVPPPLPLKEPVSAMRVTEFREYLNCPYRYYLRRRLRLEGRDMSAEELDGGAFGGLLHEVLAEFGLCEDVKHSTGPDEILRFLEAALDGLARSLFGSAPLPAVGVQLEQIRLRLKAFAEWQAGWAAEGWRIRYVEQSVDERACLVVDGAPMVLKGRIDRIDVRETAGGLEFVVFDYKTSDKGRTPEQTHRDRQGEWLDLQLPLYRHLVRALDEPALDGSPRLGYILLPRDLRQTGAHLAGWTDSDLAAADRVAHEVVRAVRREVFWPKSDDFSGFDDFAAICLEHWLGSRADAPALVVKDQ